jgi:murein DD-endopeptidase MepM/ murein hydrolase activator NlpD
VAKFALPLPLALSALLVLGVIAPAPGAAKPPHASADEHHGRRREHGDESRRGDRKAKKSSEREAKKRDRNEPRESHASRRGGSDRKARERAERLGLGTNKAAGQLLRGHPEPAWVRAAGGGAKLPGTLRFPVTRGWFVRGFGSGAGGYHQAMDIGGEVGWNVRAAASGMVAYASDGINGYGNFVMIVHPGGWVTTYAHNSKNLVVPGQKVSAGQVVALLGSTGRSKGPHVHFELLYDGENCDPGPLFRPFVPHRSGKHAQLPRATWSSAKQRPRAVTCHTRKHHPGRSGEASEEASDEEPEDET